MDFPKSPRSNLPLLEGTLDFPESPRSNLPLLEGALDFPESPRSNPPSWTQGDPRERSERANFCVFAMILSDFYVACGLRRGYLGLPRESKVQPTPGGYLGLSQKSKVQPPPLEGTLDFLKCPRSNPPLLEGTLDF